MKFVRKNSLLECLIFKEHILNFFYKFVANMGLQNRCPNMGLTCGTHMWDPRGLKKWDLQV